MGSYNPAMRSTHRRHIETSASQASRAARLLGLAALLTAGSCDQGAAPPIDEPCAAAGLTMASRLPGGDANGHADPFGARAAGQARRHGFS